jgi:aerobic carbon-monoxide dehydrogenase large subunit
MATQTFGTRISRNEDPRLLRGEGCFLDDVEAPGALHAAFLRSPMAHARIVRLDVSRAREHRGVIRVYTWQDLGRLDQPSPLLIPHPSMTQPRTQRPLARDEVCYVGQTIAAVIAVDRYVAEDALELIEVDYEPLPVVVGVEAAAAQGSPLVHADVPQNTACHLVQVEGEPDAAFAEADVVISEKFVIERSAGMPLETRGVLARHDPRTGDLTVWDSTQAPLSIRGGLAALFGLPEDRVRVIAPDTGGGFGTKVMMFYPEELIVPFAAIELGATVKWVEDRSEHFVGSNHERTQVHEIQLAAKRDGTVIGLRDSFLHDTGAFIPYGIAVAQVAAAQIAGPYRIPNIEVQLKAIYTNTVPVSPYRGCGRPHACLTIELAMDKLAAELGIDRMELRRRNFIAPDEFPYHRGGLIFADGKPVVLDSGDYPGGLRDVLEAIDYDGFRSEQERARAEGRYLGLGLACYVEGTGLGPYEGARVQVRPTDGRVFVATGLTTQGQAHETTFAQIVADRLGVSPEEVEVTTGDTGAFAYGVATFASRAAVVSGTAIGRAASKVRERALELASNMLEASPEDLELEGGEVFVRGSPAPRVTLKQIAIASNPLRYAFDEDAQAATQFAPAHPPSETKPLPEGQHPGLEATAWYSPELSTWASGVHAAIIELDPETCEVHWRRYVCSHDCGKMINPMIVEGQVLGGIAQGVGGAFYERMQYDDEGQLQNASLMEFLMPYATEVPRVEIVHRETPTPLNEFGIKGVGEAGAIPVPAVLASAVQDALEPLGVRVTRAPLSPNEIYALLHENASGDDSEDAS